jgi:hypothetical protein
MASFSSGPLVSMVIVLPTPAASNMTATILRALTRASPHSEPDAAGEPRDKVHNPGRWARVNPQRVGDFDLNFLHRMEIG